MFPPGFIAFIIGATIGAVGFMFFIKVDHFEYTENETERTEYDYYPEDFE